MSNQVYASKGHKYIDPELKELETDIQTNKNNIQTNTNNILINSGKIVNIENDMTATFQAIEFQNLDPNNRTPFLNILITKILNVVTLTIPFHTQVLVNNQGAGVTLDFFFISTSNLNVGYRPLYEHVQTQFTVDSTDPYIVSKVSISTGGQIKIYNDQQGAFNWIANAIPQGWNSLTLTYMTA